MLFTATREELIEAKNMEIENNDENNNILNSVDDKYKILLCDGDEANYTYTIIGKISDDISPFYIRLINNAEDMYSLLMKLYHHNNGINDDTIKEMLSRIEERWL